MTTHVTSVLSHGHNLAWTFIDLLRWPAEANPTINVLLTVLKVIVDQRLGVLWWCCIGRWIITSETAKIYILGFCTFLVMAGVFKKVRKCIFRSPTFLSLTPMKSSMKCKFLSASERFDKNLKRKGLRFLATVY